MGERISMRCSDFAEAESVRGTSWAIASLCTWGIGCGVVCTTGGALTGKGTAAPLLHLVIRIWCPSSWISSSSMLLDSTILIRRLISLIFIPELPRTWLFYPFHIYSGPRVHPDLLTFLQEKGHLDHGIRFQFGRLGSAAGSIAL